MRTLSAGASLATGRPYATPIFLAEITFTVPTTTTLYLADRALINVGGHDYLPFVVDWGTLESSINILDVDGRPATATLTFTNTQPIAGRDRLSDLVRTTFNPGGYEWAFATCTIRQTFDGLTASGDLVTLGIFYLEDPTEIGESRLAVRMSDQGLAIENTLQVTRVNRTEFPLCHPAQVGRSLTVPFGSLRTAPCVQVVDSAEDKLNGAITASSTSLTLFDGTDFPDGSITVQIDDEHLTGTKSGNSITGLTRAVNTTTADTHPHATPVYHVRTGTTAYRFVAGEHVGNFKIRSIANVTIDGQPPTVSPTLTLEDTTLVAGKAFAVVDFPAGAKFFSPASVSAERNVSVTAVSTTLNLSAGSPPTPLERTIAPSCIGGTTSTVRSLDGHVNRAGALGGLVNWYVFRRLSGGSNVSVATGTFNNNEGGSQYFSDSQTYASTASEIVGLAFTGGVWNDGTLGLLFDTYHVQDSATVSAGGGPVTIGTVTCDIEGIQDDTSGTITGTAQTLLQNPTDITRLILTQLYDIASASLGTTWATTRGHHQALGYRWAFQLDYAPFSQLRRLLGEQARAALYLESGLWEYQFLEESPIAGLTLTYEREVWDGEPAVLTRSSRVDVKNSLTVNARPDLSTGQYRGRVLMEDLSVIPTAQAADLNLPWIQDTATATAVGQYWLSIWRQQRFTVALTAWWNLLPMTKIDYFRIAGHPILEAHGDEAMVFRVVRRDDRVADGRIALQGVEVALLPGPRDPEEDEDMVCNCRLVFVSTTQIRLDPFQGNQIRLKTASGWQVATVPSGGVTKDTSGLSASTLYYVYAYDNSGTVTLELSTTTPSQDTVTGLQIKSGNDTRLLVGMIQTTAGVLFQDDTIFRGVLSWFNRRGRTNVRAFTATRSLSSGTYGEIDTEIRCYFLTWADEAVQIGCSGALQNNTPAASTFCTISIDGSSNEDTYARIFQPPASSAYVPFGLTVYKTGVTVGFHYATLLGSVSSGTGSWDGSGTTGVRTALTVQVRG